ARVRAGMNAGPSLAAGVSHRVKAPTASPRGRVDPRTPQKKLWVVNRRAFLPLPSGAEAGPGSGQKTRKKPTPAGVRLYWETAPGPTGGARSPDPESGHARPFLRQHLAARVPGPARGRGPVGPGRIVAPLRRPVGTAGPQDAQGLPQGPSLDGDRRRPAERP